MAIYELLVDEQGNINKGQESGLKAVVDKLTRMEATLNQMQVQLNEVKTKVENVSVGKLVLADRF